MRGLGIGIAVTALLMGVYAKENTGNMISVALYENVERAEGYSAFVVENAYYEELAAFFAAIRGEKAARYSFGQDEKVLAWIDRIEELK